MSDLNVWQMPLYRHCACKSADAHECVVLAVRRPVEPDERCECSCHSTDALTDEDDSEEEEEDDG